MEKRVVVTGLGAITPLGNSVKETWENIVAGKSGIGRTARFAIDNCNVNSDFPKIAGEVKDFNLENWGFGPKDKDRTDPVSQYSLAAGIEALRDSNLDLTKENLLRIGVQVGTGLGGQTSWEGNFWKMVKEGVRSVESLLIPKTCPNMVACCQSIALGSIGHGENSPTVIVMDPNLNPLGPTFAINTACASGAHNIAVAVNMIKGGDADIIFCGGAESCITAFSFVGFYRMAKVLSRKNDCPEKASRPFDKNRDGFIISEGAGILVLEELGHALKRGAKIHGELAGKGMTSDAYNLVVPNVPGPAACMKMALENAGVEPQEIDYIKAHGTSTEAGDKNETKSIKMVFGEKTKIPVSSPKSMLGHTIGASGAIEAIIALLAMRDGIIPPTINLENPDPECDLDYVPGKARKEELRTILCNSFGFGGANACLVFKKFKEAQ